MLDLIVFSVDKNKYALSIENVIRIIEGVPLTSVPTSHKYVDGVMSYEKSVIRVLNFRKLIGLVSYEKELESLFFKLKSAHTSWLDSLKEAIENKTEFNKEMKPHMCDLGKWIDNYSTYDEKLNDILNKLDSYHKNLHIRGSEVLALSKTDNQKALKIFQSEIQSLYTSTIKYFDIFIKEIDRVAASMQKFLIIKSNDKMFAIKIDSIDDITHVEDSDVIDSEDDDDNEFLKLNGVVDLEGVLVNIIKSVEIPK